MSTDDTEIRDLIKRRQQARHLSYGLTASGLGVTTLAVWVFTLTEGRHTFGQPLTQGYAALLSLSIVLGLATAMATGTWMIVRDRRRGAAESDRIREHRDRQHLADVRDALTGVLAQRDRDEMQAKWEGFANLPYQGGGVTPIHRGRGPAQHTS